MRPLSTMLSAASLISLALAVSAASPRDETEVQMQMQMVRILYQECASGTSVEVHSGDALVAEACSNTLDMGAFAQLPIRFDVDRHGAGNVTVGPITYRVHESKEVSGGIVCGRFYDGAESVVSCDVAVPASLPLRHLSKRHECIPEAGGGGLAALAFAKSMHALESSSTMEDVGGPVQIETRQSGTPGFSKRQGCYDMKWTDLVGDGDPHQNYWHSQISENNECGSAICSVGYETSKSISVGFSVDTGASITDWISGGFSVSASWSTGVTQGCETPEPGNTLCMWYRTAHTAYTVRNGVQSTCSFIKSYSKPFVLFSPNTNNVGGGYYCVVGAQYCRHQGAGYWDKSGRAGGP